MHPGSWLESAFGSESRVRILRSLSADPAKLRTEREIAALVRMSPNAVNKAVARLQEAGLLDVRPVGKAHAVRLRDDPVLLAILRDLFRSEQNLWRSTKAAIAQCVPKDAACYMFGSSARATAGAESDIDLLVIAQDREKASAIAYAIQAKVHAGMPARLHVIAIPVGEAAQRLRKGSGLVAEAVRHGEQLSARGLDELVGA